jgi:hypothetical protein
VETRIIKSNELLDSYCSAIISLIERKQIEEKINADEGSHKDQGSPLDEEEKLNEDGKVEIVDVNKQDAQDEVKTKLLTSINFIKFKVKAFD